jgi:hypothetical protein
MNIYILTKYYILILQNKNHQGVLFFNGRICVENYFNDSISDGIMELKYYAVELCMHFSLAFMILKN